MTASDERKDRSIAFRKNRANYPLETFLDLDGAEFSLIVTLDAHSEVGFSSSPPELDSVVVIQSEYVHCCAKISHS